MKASYLLSAFSKIINPENATQFDLVNDTNSQRVNDLLIHNTIPITFYDNLLIFRDTGKKFDSKRDLLKMITNKNYKVDIARLLDKKLMCDFENGLHFDVKTKKSTRKRTLMRLLESPGLMISVPGISDRIFLPSGFNECNRLKLLKKTN